VGGGGGKKKFFFPDHTISTNPVALLRHKPTPRSQTVRRTVKQRHNGPERNWHSFTGGRYGAQPGPKLADLSTQIRRRPLLRQQLNSGGGTQCELRGVGCGHFQADATNHARRSPDRDRAPCHSFTLNDRSLPAAKGLIFERIPAAPPPSTVRTQFFVAAIIQRHRFQAYCRRLAEAAL